MSKILFVNGNLYGHINPTIPVMKELVKKGEEVWCFCSENFKEKVLETGATYLGYGETITYFLKEYHPSGSHPFYTILEYLICYDEVMIPELLKVITREHLKFDCVVCDSILGGGYFLKQLLHVTTICSHSSFAMSRLPIPERMMVEGFHPQLDACYHTLKRMCETWGMEVPTPGELFLSKGDINLVYTSKKFNGDENLDESYQFVGASIDARKDSMDFPWNRIKGRNVIYISLGTINNNFKEFYEMCIRAFSQTDVTVVMSIGNKCTASDLNNAPDNFIIQNYVPQLEVLKHASVFITHCGFNSISEALYYEVPVIAIPMMNDQYMVSKRIDELKLGIPLKMEEIKEESLQQAVHDILSNEEYKYNASIIGNELRDGGGFIKAAECIMEFIKKRTRVAPPDKTHDNNEGR